ncbi:hypothetical protein [Aquimarina brevivitae]|nr:hypothetical protein [Aquimarina brevivitae]
MKKGTIDVEVLTEIISDKQKELKEEALKRFMLKLFPETNYTTKYYIQNSMNLLLNEKNPEVIEKEILELTTNYALALGTAYALYRKKRDTLDLSNNILEKVNYSAYEQKTGIYQKNEIRKYKKLLDENRAGLFKSNLLRQEFEVYRLKKDLMNNKNRELFISKIDSLKVSNEEYDKKSKRLYKIKQRRGIDEANETYNRIKDLAFKIREQIGKLESNNKEELYDLLEKLKIQELYKKVEKKNENTDSLIRLLNEFRVDNILKRDEKNIPNQKIDLPFELVVDVTSSALSEIKELRGKGFFKNKIDYRNGNFYKSLSSTDAGLKLKIDLDSLHIRVKEKVEPYVLYYDVIKELIKETNFSDKKSDEIIDELKNRVINILSSDLSSLSNLNDTSLKTFLTNIDNRNQLIDVFEKIISLKNQFKVIGNTGSFQIEFLNKLQNNLIAIDEYNKIYTNSNSLKPLIDEDYNSLNELSDVPLGLLNYLIIETKEIPDTGSIKAQAKFINDQISQIKRTKEIEDFKKIYQIINNSFNEIKDSSPEIEPLSTYLNISLNIDTLSALNKRIQDVKDKIKTYQEKFPKTKIEETIKENLKFIIEDKNFINNSIQELSNEILNGKIKFKDSVIKDATTVNRTTKLITELYARMNKIRLTNNFTLLDINYMDTTLKEILIELEIKDPFDNNEFNEYLKDFAIKVTPLLKIKKLQTINKLGKYDKSLLTLFEFIGNLNNLDKAETFKSIVDMIRTGSEEVEANLPDTKFKESYLLFINAMKKYTLINVNENYVEVDVASFLTDLEVYFNRNDASRFSLYLSLGLNQNLFFAGDTEFPGIEERINNIGFASEKLGLRLRLHSFKRYGGYENVIKDDIYLNKNAPFINDWYAIVYGSGLLYSLANTSTNENFDFTHIGIGTGFRFYNALDINFMVGFPFIKDKNFGDKAFVGMGFDIPLGEYLEKLGNK